MANINTSSANRSRDFTTGASPMREQHFMDLYDEIMGRLIYISKLNCTTTIQIELNKLRQKKQKLITKYINPALSELATNEQYKKEALASIQKISEIRKTLAI